MSVAKTIVAVAGTAAVLAATAFVPPWASHLQDEQLSGTVHTQPDSPAPATTSAGTQLQERLQVFQGAGDQIMTLTQAISTAETEEWADSFFEVWESLQAHNLLAERPERQLATATLWGDRTLYWDPKTSTVISTVSIFQSLANDDGEVVQEGWVRFDEASGLPVSFSFSMGKALAGDATGAHVDFSVTQNEAAAAVDIALGTTEKSAQNPEAAKEPDPEAAKKAPAETVEESAELAEERAVAVAQWLADQWGLSVNEPEAIPEGYQFAIDGTAAVLTVNVDKAPWAVEATLGLPSETGNVVVDTRTLFEILGSNASLIGDVKN